ncbi:hypothetical protein V8F33_009166 [Rhypophila sp. PSN 637]
MAPSMFKIVALLLWTWEASAADCPPSNAKPIALPVRDVLVDPSIPGSFMRGIPARIGSSPQPIVLLPWAELNNTWIYHGQFNCSVELNLSDTTCRVRRGSYFHPSDSETFRKMTDIVTAGGSAVEITTLGTELDVGPLVSASLGGTDIFSVGDGDSAVVVDSMPIGVPRFNWDHGYIERRRLLEIMSRKIDGGKGFIRTSSRVSSLQEEQEHVIIETKDGYSVSADLVIGADGVRSCVRKVLDSFQPANRPTSSRGFPSLPCHLRPTQQIVTAKGIPEDMSTRFACVYGITRPTTGISEGEVFSVYRPGESVLIFTGKDGVAYWFVIEDLGEELPLSLTPRCTAEDIEVLSIEDAAVLVNEIQKTSSDHPEGRLGRAELRAAPERFTPARTYRTRQAVEKAGTICRAQLCHSSRAAAAVQEELPMLCDGDWLVRGFLGFSGAPFLEGVPLTARGRYYQEACQGFLENLATSVSNSILMGLGMEKVRRPPPKPEVSGAKTAWGGFYRDY